MKQYEDILYLPHPTSKKRPRMPKLSRAAQFAPFSALAGLETAIKDTQNMVELQTERSTQEEDSFL